MNPRYDESIDFLKLLHPGRRWLLVGLDPEMQADPVGATFTEAQTRDCLLWLEKWGETHNLYYSLAPTKQSLSKKPLRKDLSAVHYLHVDIDPESGNDVKAEQERITKLLTPGTKDDIIPGKLPPPTAIVFSGGGYQVLWKLLEPLPITGDTDHDIVKCCDEYAAYNRWIADLLDGDNCHNVDRLLRLPGTLNRPNEKKRQAGRTLALAKLLKWEDHEPYKITFFQKKYDKKNSKEDNDAPPAEDKIKRTHDLSTIPGLSASTIGIISQGHDPFDPLKFSWPPDRSRWLFSAVCSMVRANCDDETIYGIITDPNWKISESIIELNYADAIHRYATRQIEQARAVSVDKNLEEMNTRYAVIGSVAGKCRVAEEQFDDDMNRSSLVLSTFEDLMKRHCHEQVESGANAEGEALLKQKGSWWLHHKNRRQYDKIIFSPGREIENCYNLWRGFGVDSKAGDCSLFLEHLRSNVCCNNSEYYDYLLGWAAMAVQCPAMPGQVAVVLKGDQGTGKGFFAHTLGRLFGRHYLQVVNSKHLTGNFNSHLRDVVLLFADEAVFAPDKSHSSVLKTLVTENQIVIERKGIDAESCSNYIHLIMASNDHFVVPAGMGDRRFFVLKVCNEHKDDHAYFEAIKKQMDEGGYEALLHVLMNLDLSKFNVRAFPKTEELLKQKGMSAPFEEQWLMERLHDGRWDREQGEWRREVAQANLYADYLRAAKSGRAYRTVSLPVLLGILGEYLSIHTYRVGSALEIVDVDGRKYYEPNTAMVRFDELPKCRESFERKFGQRINWSAIETENLWGEVNERV